jgi:putative ABC transport system permease protein
MALGADRGDITAGVLRSTVVLVGTGWMLGLTGALAIARTMGALLYGVAATDPLTIIAASGFLLSVAFVAVWLPVRRATRVDPIVALRYE